MNKNIFIYCWVISHASLSWGNNTSPFAQQCEDGELCAWTPPKKKKNPLPQYMPQSVHSFDFGREDSAKDFSLSYKSPPSSPQEKSPRLLPQSYFDENYSIHPSAHSYSSGMPSPSHPSIPLNMKPKTQPIDHRNTVRPIGRALSTDISKRVSSLPPGLDMASLLDEEDGGSLVLPVTLGGATTGLALGYNRYLKNEALNKWTKAISDAVPKADPTLFPINTMAGWIMDENKQKNLLSDYEKKVAQAYKKLMDKKNMMEAVSEVNEKSNLNLKRKSAMDALDNLYPKLKGVNHEQAIREIKKLDNIGFIDFWKTRKKLLEASSTIKDDFFKEAMGKPIKWTKPDILEKILLYIKGMGNWTIDKIKKARIADPSIDKVFEEFMENTSKVL